MALTGISNRGLVVMGLLVMILWACIFTERTIVRHAYEETQNVLRARPVIPVKQERDARFAAPAPPVPFA